MNDCVLTHRRNPDRSRRAARNSLVCTGCRLGLEAALVGENRYDSVRGRIATPGLAELHRDLQGILGTGSPTGGTAVGGTRDRPLPFSPAVSTHRWAIVEHLARWVTDTAAERDEHGPTGATVAVMSRWLVDRLDHIAQQDTVAAFTEDVHQLRGRALALLDPVRKSRFTAGWCAQGVANPIGLVERCPGALVAEVTYGDAKLPSLVWCDVCGTEWPPHKWLQLARQVQPETVSS